jgi:hypothetical protein
MKYHEQNLHVQEGNLLINLVAEAMLITFLIYYNYYNSSKFKDYKFFLNLK